MGTRKRRLAISREPGENGFVYRRGGRKINRRSEISRIEALAIPPAWVEVEVSSSPGAKVQARGIDAAGRTQTLYHPAYRRRQDRKKFDRMLRFGRALPRLRARVDHDLRRRRLSRDRVAACVIYLIDQQLFRVGNPEYAAEYGSYGITTLREEHLEVTSTMVDFNFKGKSGKEHHQQVRDPRVARILSQLLELPGPEVFRFVDDDDMTHLVQSRHVNSYIRRYLGREFSAKDFRTWGGTVTVAAAILAAEPDDFTSEAGRALILRRAIELAAERLGNTPAVTRSSYVDPRILETVERPRLLARIRATRFRNRRFWEPDEQRTLALLST